MKPSFLLWSDPWDGIRSDQFIVLGTKWFPIRPISVSNFDFTSLLTEINGVTANSANEVPNSDFTSLPAATGGVTAVDLVNQAAEMVQSIEDYAAETTARAYGLAHKASEQLEFANSQMRALKSAQSAMEERCRATNARADKAEQMVRQSKAQIAAMEESLSAADRRARNAEARVIEAEKILELKSRTRSEKSCFRNGSHPPPIGRSRVTLTRP